MLTIQYNGKPIAEVTAEDLMHELQRAGDISDDHDILELHFWQISTNNRSEPELELEFLVLTYNSAKQEYYFTSVYLYEDGAEWVGTIDKRYTDEVKAYEDWEVWISP